MKSFALIGAAGYIAPRHMAAIRDTGNRLIAAMDRNDSVGVIDSYFPDADFFTEFERFDRHLDKGRRSGKGTSYVAVCSPNYLHDSHVRFALRSDADAVCEKPLVLNPWNIDGLQDIERDTGRRVFTILQLRLHPAIVELREKVQRSRTGKKYDVDLTYITSRGKWYMQSWKGEDRKSGGIATNIGVHFFDMLYWVFGEVKANTVHLNSASMAAGFIEFESARVRWFLSIDRMHLPETLVRQDQTTFRSITINNEELEFSEGFADLHTRSYEEILAGRGFGLNDNRVAIETVAEIRNAQAVGRKGEYHPLVKE